VIAEPLSERGTINTTGGNVEDDALLVVDAGCVRVPRRLAVSPAPVAGVW